MQIGQNLLLQMGGSTGSTESLNAVLQDSQDEAQSFAQLLDMQDPAQLESLLQQLGIADPAAALAELRQLQIDGKLLPPDSENGNSLTLQTEDSEIAATLAESSAEGVAAVAAEWLHWLDQSRLVRISNDNGETPDTPDTPDATTEIINLDTGDITSDSQTLSPAINNANQPASSAGKDSLAQLAAGNGAESQRSNPLPGNPATNAADSQRLPASNGNSGVDSSLNLNNNDNQRQQNASPVRQNVDLSLLASRTDVSARLAEVSERPAGRSSASDREAIESAIKSLTQATSASAQAALTARPVQAPPMTLGVPFGQTGYAESLVEKVMWMSSQNLRSAEIRLDPADLGPLEIHIQSRGQEHQVQFVSLNPSVREALEAQAFRLREMFSQQGLDLQNVSVSDQSAGQQGREQQTLADGSGERSGRGNREVHGGHEGDDPQDTRGSSQPLAQLISSRLIDYYA